MTLSQLEVTGAEIYAMSTANKLIEFGHNVFIASDTLKTVCKTKATYIPAPLSNRSIFYRVKNSIWLIRFIKRNNIQIVNAHSRASAWVSQVACHFAKVPLIVFIHGRQSTFLSRRLFHAFGDYTIAVCEKMEHQLLTVFGVTKSKIEILRNGFDLKKLTALPFPGTKRISLMGRLSGPKGDLAYKILEHFVDKMIDNQALKNVEMVVVGGEVIPERFKKFKDVIKFTGFVDGLENLINQSSVVIGSGRIAMEAIILKRPVVAIGEACTIGLISSENIDHALATNFGDMNLTEKNFDFDKLFVDLIDALNMNCCDPLVYEKVIDQCDIEKNTLRLESIFQSLLVRYHHSEIPVLCYHRVVNDVKEAGKNGIYVTTKQFETHLNYLAKKKYKAISFNQALEIKKNGTRGKYVIITFDDGYYDNYTNAFPLLKKYGLPAIIFLVSELLTNSWDNQSGEPEVKMMNHSQILEMLKSGIMFGAHTLTHKDLTALSPSQASYEIEASKKILESAIGKTVDSFAYPYGKLNEEVKRMAQQAGFSSAFATDNAPLGLHEDVFQIRRIVVFPNTNLLGFSRKVKGNYIFKRIGKDSNLLSIPK